jgi:3-mercaptopyruvate sulfurtransferase SseA
MRLLLSTATAVALGAALLVAAACNPEAYDNKARANVNNAPNAPIIASATQPQQQQPAQPGDDVRRVTVAELKQALDAGQALVVDVRNQAAYDAGHIKGAKLVPAAEVDKHVNELPKDKLIVTYCS